MQLYSIYYLPFTKKEDRVEEYLWQSYKSIWRRMENYESSYFCKLKKQREGFCEGHAKARKYLSSLGLNHSQCVQQ